MERKADSHNLPLDTKIGKLDKWVAKSLTRVVMETGFLPINERKLIVLELSPLRLDTEHQSNLRKFLNPGDYNSNNGL